MVKQNLTTLMQGKGVYILEWMAQHCSADVKFNRSKTVRVLHGGNKSPVLGEKTYSRSMP